MFENYRPMLQLPGCEHPVALTESQAMQAIKLPKPTYQPILPRAVVENGLISQAQLETIIYAGEAHSKFLDGYFLVDDNLIDLTITNKQEEKATQMRGAFFLADGTGAGKSRQLLGIIIDNWLKGITKHIFVTVNDKLIPDLIKEWQILGGDPQLIIPLKNIKQGESITAKRGVLVTTYGQIRTQAKRDKISRIEQIAQWANKDNPFEGTLIFDESHNLANAVPEKSARGLQNASLQAVSGIQLQNLLPLARIVYSSATAFTKLENLYYANRLGLWNRNRAFSSQKDFLVEMGGGGLSALELIANNAKAMGVYFCRSLSFDGVEYQKLEHELTEVQIQNYNQYAEIFKQIGLNIHKVMQACNITDGKTTLNSSAKKNTLGQFESLKQRFFEMLLISSKLPTVVKSIEEKIANGEACVIQLINTNESLLVQQLNKIPQEQWNNLNVDITPRENIVHYLNNCFPTELYRVEKSAEGNFFSTPELDEQGNHVHSSEAIAIRDDLIQKLTFLPPITAPIDQLIFHFGADKIAEITGRSTRLVKDENGNIKVEKRAASANKADEKAFMDDQKQILIFSAAGGTGRSYHASVKAKNQRKRNHYLLQIGFNIYSAVQGFGRTHRSDQVCTPLFIICSTNVKGEKRFSGTVAQRLASLGALTKGQSTAANNEIVDDSDDINNIYGSRALATLLYQIYNDELKISAEEFEQNTGIFLKTKTGSFISEMPSINQFLNRLLALPIEDQNYLFDLLSELIKEEIDIAKQSGRYDRGIENIKADKLILENEIVLWEDTKSSNKAILHTVLKEQKIIYNHLPPPEENPQTIWNSLNGNVAFWAKSYSKTDIETGESIPQVLLTSPEKKWHLDESSFFSSNWQAISYDLAQEKWQEKLKDLPIYQQELIYLISGLLLPIWQNLKIEKLKLRRLETDCGKRILGKLVTNPYLILANFNLDSDQLKLSPQNYLTILNTGQKVTIGNYVLSENRVKFRHLIELSGWKQEEIQYFLSLGCFVEVIDFRARLFFNPKEDVLSLIETLLETRN